MYELNDLQLWRQHHRELLWEAEQERLARHLRAARHPRKAHGIRDALLGLVPNRLPRKKGMAEC